MVNFKQIIWLSFISTQSTYQSDDIFKQIAGLCLLFGQMASKIYSMHLQHKWYEDVVYLYVTKINTIL